MKNKFLNDVSLILEKNKKPTLSILLEKKKSKENFPEDPFEEEKSEDDEDSEGLEGSEDDKDSEGLEGSEDSEGEKDEQQLKDDAERIEKEAMISAIIASDEVIKKREVEMEKLALSNPLSNLVDSKYYSIKKYLLEDNANSDDINIDGAIDKFIKGNEDKIHKFKVGVEKERKGFGINVQEEVNNAVKNLKSFDKKVNPPDLVRFTYMQRIIDFSPAEEIEKNMELFDDLYYKEVKEIPEYSNYNREDINISLKNNYNNAIVGTTSAG